MSKLRDWAELFRLPNVFTAMADPLAGALIVGATWGYAGNIIILMIASAFLYTAGIVLNDWHDYKEDLAERPHRPLPSRRIGRLPALLVALLLFALGGLAAAAAGAGPGRVAGLLIAAIILYDVLLKDVPIAPALLGACRSLNLLLGMTLIPADDSPVGWSMRILLLVVIGLYVLGISLVARKETAPQASKQLAGGAIVACVAVLIVSTLRFFFPDQAPHVFGIAWAALLILAIGYRMTQAILAPKPETVQLAVKTGLIGLILLDAAAVAFARGIPVSLIVVVLVVPAILLGKWLYST